MKEISSFVEQYNKPATKEILCIEAEKRSDINDSSYKDVTNLISSLENEPSEFEWLINTTEKWCRDRAIYLALMESIQLADGKDDTKGRDAIPTILSDALAVSFDSHVGHDYLLIMRNVMNLTIEKKTRYPLIWSSLTRSQRVAYRIKRLISLLLALVLVSLCLCAILPVLFYSKVKTFFTSRWRWQKRRLQRESMRTF